MFASKNKYLPFLKLALLGMCLLSVIGLVRFFNLQIQVTKRDQFDVPFADRGSASVNSSAAQIDVISEPRDRSWESDEVEPKRLTDEEQQEALFVQIVERFPLNEGGELELNDATKSFLNMVYNGLNGGSQPGLDGEAMNQLQIRLEQELPTGAGDQAAQLLWHYFEYRNAERDILVPELNGEKLIELFDQIKELRRSYLGEAVADSLFGEEEAMASFVIQARLLSKDTQLSMQQRQEKSRALQAAFIERFSDSIPTQAIDAVQQRANRMREQGADEAEIFNMQVNSVGRQKAEAMADQ